MSRVLEIRGPYKVLATNRDYVVVNTLKDYTHHAHFKKMSTVSNFLRMIEGGKKPHSPYLMKAARRLMGDSFEGLGAVRKKEKYINRSGRRAG